MALVGGGEGARGVRLIVLAGGGEGAKGNVIDRAGRTRRGSGRFGVVHVVYIGLHEERRNEIPGKIPRSSTHW